MTDTFGKANRATPAATLEQQILDPNHPKNIREWWARLEITALRAKVEKLNKSRNKWGQKYNKLLEQHKVTVSQLKAAVWSDSEECKLLTAENERLRAALREIAEGGVSDHPPTLWAFARAALEEK